MVSEASRVRADRSSQVNIALQSGCRTSSRIANPHPAPSRGYANPFSTRKGLSLTVLPNGWVFHEAESAAGFAKGLGAIKFDLNRRHSSLAQIAWNQNGLVHSYDEYKQKYGRP